MSWVATIGLETHVQLHTESKMFCACCTGFGAAPNTHVCPVCLGYPGAMPVMNGKAIELTVRSGLMLSCEIPLYSKFDRKSYFYPDMPKNYQISQYDMPLCQGGGVDITVDGQHRRIELTRIHLEEDVGKSMHFKSSSGVDFNRAGVPLMEIVSEPDLHTPEEAMAYLAALKQILLYAEVSDCNLEEGNMRCDVNISIAPAGSDTLGTKAEIKNMNTFRGVQNAVRYEIARQIDVLESGGRIVQETRRWDPDTEMTSSMRTKEDAHDYRYFPEPDLMPVVLAEAQIEAWRATLPEPPAARRERLVSEYGIPEYDAGVLAADKRVGDFFEEAARASGNAKAASNWIMTEMLRLLGEQEMDIADVRVAPAALAELIGLVDGGALNSNSAKEVFAELFAEGGDPKAIVAAKGLTQVSDSGAIEGFVQQAIEENPQSVEDFRNGKTKAAKFLVGQVMRLSKGKANPKMVGEIIARLLS
ncbi:MAG: Asp-tRNA(Asn)/Glu-tRNA(Gln) amidotransferase subunit GatB [Kiritimatiellia bacterium]|nr:Asp-tRNA(Asn)/Glu-tRNA(Gln) amidotransferase subunit GatB [Kiritimatiellia bacterium]MDP6811463.1 Asp-tRNA(Asn)/Glu-tRNA(Gln) amidotransferase subunit GatB [Kiritimatiellia bacterium]MDP7024647.1 Asp-tRNA(Asn)/Glu-tRNA(Gln) amidotransferase subunit GatB [Kiritimatiellia bacterium]